MTLDEHNRKMWERLAEAGILYTRPVGKPPRDARGKRRFLDGLTHGRLRGVGLEHKRVLSLAGGAGGTPSFSPSSARRRRCSTSPSVSHDGARARAGPRHQAALRAGRHARPSTFADGEFDIVSHHHSLVFVPMQSASSPRPRGSSLPARIYVFSTMHPVALRMQETWTGTGWGSSSAIWTTVRALADALWEFGSVKVEARTLEYGHRTSDLVNACAKNGLLVDGLWSTRQATTAASPGQRMSLSAGFPRTSRSGLVGSRWVVAQRLRLIASGNASAQRGARFGVLRRDLADPPRCNRDIHRPADAEDPFREHRLIAVRVPVRLAQTVQRRQTEVVGTAPRPCRSRCAPPVASSAPDRSRPRTPTTSACGPA